MINNYIIVCANYDEHITMLSFNSNILPIPRVYISTSLMVNDQGWKRKGLKWYCPECNKVILEAIKQDNTRELIGL